MLQLPTHLHPMVVHFPIALFITAFLFEVISLIIKSDNLHKAAIYMYVTASLITPFVLRTGLWEAEKVNLSHPILAEHAQYATWLMWTSLMSLPVLWFIHRELKKCFKIVFIILLLTTTLLVAFTGDKGGQMVYEYGVGVEK